VLVEDAKLAPSLHKARSGRGSLRAYRHLSNGAKNFRGAGRRPGIGSLGILPRDRAALCPSHLPDQAMQERPRQASFKIGLTATTHDEVTKAAVQIAKVVSPRSPRMWNTFQLTRLVQDELEACDEEVARNFLINFHLIVTRDQIKLERTTPLDRWKEIFAVPNERKIV
jgi:hypothetical protein